MAVFGQAAQFVSASSGRAGLLATRFAEIDGFLFAFAQEFATH